MNVRCNAQTKIPREKGCSPGLFRRLHCRQRSRPKFIAVFQICTALTSSLCRYKVSWYPVLSRYVTSLRRNRTILDPVAGPLDLGFQIGRDLVLSIMEQGKSDAAVLQGACADAGLDSTIGNRLYEL